MLKTAFAAIKYIYNQKCYLWEILFFINKFWKLRPKSFNITFGLPIHTKSFTQPLSFSLFVLFWLAFFPRFPHLFSLFSSFSILHSKYSAQFSVEFDLYLHASICWDVHLSLSVFLCHLPLWFFPCHTHTQTRNDTEQTCRNSSACSAL